MTKKDILSCLIMVTVIILIRSFIVTFVRVDGTSMDNTLADNEIMVLKKYDKKNIERFDIVVLKYKDEKLIKRVIGMPKEDVEYKDDNLYINDKTMDENYSKGVTKDFKDYCGSDEYFVMGDNREVSVDSRALGCIKKSDIVGTTDFIVFPFSKFGKVK